MKSDVANLKKKMVIGIILMTCFLSVGFWIVFAENFINLNSGVQHNDVTVQARRLEKHGVLKNDGNKKNKTETRSGKTLSSNEIIATIYDGKNYRKTVDSETVIALSGNMPKCAVAKAYKARVKIGDKKILLAYDIKIFDKKGNEFQPKKGSPVKVAFESNRLKHKNKINVFHLENEGAKPEKIASGIKMKSNKITFNAQKFSIYAVEDGDDLPFTYEHTYEFYGKNGKIISKDTQVLSEGEKLKEPPAPIEPNTIFEGWYTEPNGGTKFENWKPEKELKANKTTRLYAHYRVVFHVYYKSEARMPTEDNPVVVKFVQQYDIADIPSKLNYTDVPVHTKEGYALVGWSRTPEGNQPVINNVTEVRSDMRLFPIIKEAVWIIYDSNDGSFVDPNYVLKGENSKAPDNPKRPGHTFAGWYKSKNLEKSSKFTFGSRVTENIKLYAKWIPAKANYTVVFWEQNSGDDKNASDGSKTYAFKEAETRSGITGESASIGYYDKIRDFRDSAYHFHYNPNRSSKLQKINSDGSTILNVYYDRDLYTIKYVDEYGRELPSKRQTGLYGSSLANNGYTWDTSYDWRNIKDGVRYSFLSDFLFPQGAYDVTNSTNDPDDTGRVKSTILTLKRSRKGAATSTVSHYIQKTDGSYREYPENSTSSNAGAFNLSNKYTGFTVKRYRRYYAGTNSPYDSGAGRAGMSIPLINDYRYYLDLDVFYERNKYKLIYAYGINKAEITSKDILYEASIGAEYRMGEPARPRDLNGNYLIPSYYHFEGWFKDPQGQTEFKFDGSDKMQSNNQVAYAVWKPNRISVKFDLDNGKSADGKSSIDTQTFDAGNKAEKPENPQKDGYEFAGWLNKKNGNPVNFDKAVTENVEVIAAWISEKGYRTTYDPNGGEGEQRQGPKVYAPGSPVKVVSIDDTWNWKAPKDKAGFLHWNTKPDDSGVKFFPGQDLPFITENTVLYAIWADNLDLVLKYDMNHNKYAQSPNSLVNIVSIKNHTKINAGINSNGEYISTNRGVNYEFLGWSRIKIWRSESLDGKLIRPGASILVDTKNEENNILYAQWRRKIKVTIKKDVEGSMSDPDQKFKFKWSTEFRNDDGSVDKKERFYDLSSEDSSQTLIQEAKEGTKITVEEVDPKATSHKFNRLEVTEVAADQPHDEPQGKIEGSKWIFTVGEDSNNILLTYTNRKDEIKSPITGIFTSNRPYYLLLIPAFILIYVFRKRRKHYE